MPKFENGINTTNAYVQFGKFMIQKKMLEEQNILLVKYKNSYGPVAGIRRTVVSDPFKIFIVNLLDVGKINYELLKDCPEQDRILFESLIKKADLVRVLKYEKPLTNLSDIYLKERFEILRGEAIAGNNSPDIKKELIKVMDQLVVRGKLKKDDAEEFKQLLDE